MTTQDRTRSGLTMVELVVVVAVIAMLLAIILPALQYTRETSRRSVCVSNLRNFGDAIHSFESRTGKFPAASNFNDPRTNYGGLWSAQAVLLADLGYAQLMETAGVLRGVPPLVDTGQPEWAERSPEIFTCPTDPVDGGINFVVCTGSGPSPYRQKDMVGAISQHYGRYPAEVTDGLSNTAAMSEQTKSSKSMRFDRRVHFWASGANGLPGGYGSTAALRGICDALIETTDMDFDRDKGSSWTRGSFGRTWYNHTAAPNANSRDCSAQSEVAAVNAEGVHPARSWHPGGVNVLLLDGSVRFTSDAIEEAIWHAAGTIAGGEMAVQF